MSARLIRCWGLIIILFQLIFIPPSEAQMVQGRYHCSNNEKVGTSMVLILGLEQETLNMAGVINYFWKDGSLEYQIAPSESDDSYLSGNYLNTRGKVTHPPFTDLEFIKDESYLEISLKGGAIDVQYKCTENPEVCEVVSRTWKPGPIVTTAELVNPFPGSGGGASTAFENFTCWRF